MRLTLYTDYGVRALIYLAVRPDGFGTVRSIADAYQISRNHLMKVVQELSRCGYVNTVRGRGGGIRLRLKPKDICVGQVVRDMETDLEIVECFGPGNRCGIAPECTLKHVLADALEAFLAVLDRYTLADLVSNAGALQRLLDVRLVDPPGRLIEPFHTVRDLLQDRKSHHGIRDNRRSPPRRGPGPQDAQRRHHSGGAALR